MRRTAIKRAAVALGAVLAAVGLLVGCSSSSGGADKAGGSKAPRVLRLAANIGPYIPARADLDYFAREVKQLSSGGLQVRVSFGPIAHDPGNPAFETGIAHAVADGSFDLGWVGAAGWDERGVTSLRALQAPFLVTDYALLGRVVTGPIGAQMLAGLRRAGVVGVALVPGILAHPLGVKRAFVTLRDYAGARVGDIQSHTTDALLRALGATPIHVTGFEALQHGSVDGAAADVEDEEQTGNCSSRCAWVIGTTVTINAALFANAETLFANPRSLARLSDHQRAVVRNAAARTVTHAADQSPGETAAVREFCRNNGHAVAATPRALVALERATRPVTTVLQRDPQTASLISRIRALKTSTRPVPPAAAPAGCAAAARPVANGPRRSPSILNGTYRYVITKHDALTRGDPADRTPKGAAQYPQVFTQVLRDGKWFGGGQPNGTYTVTGNHLDFDWVSVGYDLHFIYARDHDGTLHLTPVPPMENGDRFIFSTEPWRRVGPPLVQAR